jgi:CspA family cold shock protein
MDTAVHGKCKWFSNERGYGFVCEEDNESEEYFVHYSSIILDGYKTLTAGQPVTFSLKDTDKGIQAIDVVPE